jgi:pantetheine-phosphate adenylyltransferase
LKRAIFPGTFDPFTKGHEGVVQKALLLFDEVIIAIGENMQKRGYFDLDKRVQHIQSLFNQSNVRVQTYSGLTVHFCNENDVSFIVRGLRDSKDFVYERSIAHMNNKLGSAQTIFILTDPAYSAINSSIVREIHKNGGDISSFVTNAHKLV